MNKTKGDFAISANFDLQKEGAIDARTALASYDQLLQFSSDDYIYNGFLTSVWDTDPAKRGIYRCINKAQLSNPTSWVKLVEYNADGTVPGVGTGSGDYPEPPVVILGDELTAMGAQLVEVIGDGKAGMVKIAFNQEHMFYTDIMLFRLELPSRGRQLVCAINPANYQALGNPNQSGAASAFYTNHQSENVFSLNYISSSVGVYAFVVYPGDVGVYSYTIV